MKKIVLMILDGWGIGDRSGADVVYHQSKYVKSLAENPDVAAAHLDASGRAVGLPDGQMGNSEVGHLNIGAGRVVYQDLVKINVAIEDKSFFQNNVLNEACQYAKDNDRPVHLIGLVGDGGVHAMSAHVMAICDLATQTGLKKVYLHGLMDGRDTDPRSGKAFMKTLNDYLNENTIARVASVCGRYYTMDRDKRWERVKVGYDLLVNGIGAPAKDPVAAIQDSYDKGVTDEFIKPIAITGEDGQPMATIQPGDVVICFNFRTDRLRQITTALTQQDFPDLGMKTMPLHYLTLTRYDESFKGVKIVYDKQDLKNTLGEILEQQGKSQIRIAETEKYAHVTFFFSGGREDAFKGETRILIPSPKVATYDLQPEMSAPEVRDAILPELQNGQVDFVCLNFANCDMVGHTGIYGAIEKAVETVDQCVEAVATTAIEKGYSFMIIADHGNADFATNADGSMNTAHSTNPVPLILVDRDFKTIRNGRLADVAPTILKVMGLDIPEEMTGDVLV